MIRLATSRDDLTALLGPLTTYNWNRDNLLVAEQEGVIVGLVILWDGGHGIIHIDNLVVAADHLSEHVGMALMRGCEEEARRRGATVLMGATSNVRFAAACMKRGLKVSVPLFNLWRDVSSQKGAESA